MNDRDFQTAFEQLTGSTPFSWQRRLFRHFRAGEVPEVCDIPTGLGKTSVIAIWLIALAQQQFDTAGFRPLPRRLIYVVDRRTVVDQATDVAARIRSRLIEGAAPLVLEGLGRIGRNPKQPLAISTLRGEFADNGEWQSDPVGAAIIVGTVDMIGSRLLFSGYGVSRKMRPFHAGLLGHDSLIVHDESHLSPAFGKLIAGIRDRQESTLRPLRAMDLSATQRVSDAASVFRLQSEEMEEREVVTRLRARKRLRLVSLLAGSDLPTTIANLALKHEGAPARVMIYVRSPAVAKRIAELLPATRTAVLTGTIRGFERDQMASTRFPIEQIADEEGRRRASIFRSFRADPDRTPPTETQYLIATSAGEVGVDLDADHLVCDLTTLDSMIQRLGRVNRLGRGEASIEVVDATEDDDDEHQEPPRLRRTVAALATLPLIGDQTRDASPIALRKLVDDLGPTGIGDCFAPLPRLAELTDVLLDTWALTCLDDLPGRLPVARWLHGSVGTPPSIYLAWRDEVSAVTEAENPEAALRLLFEEHPILGRERVRGPLGEVVIADLIRISKRLGERRVVVISERGAVGVDTLETLVRKENWDRLRDATIVLPTDAGGLDPRGMLDGRIVTPVIDVADRNDGADPERLRVLLTWNEDEGAWSSQSVGASRQLFDESDSLATGSVTAAIAGLLRRMASMREKGRVILKRHKDDGTVVGCLILLAQRGIAQSDNAQRSQALDDHNAQTGQVARSIVSRAGDLGFGDRVAIGEAIAIAADRHDLGKARRQWQLAIGNTEPAALAKSGRRGFDPSACGRYRHEAGSVRQASADPMVRSHSEHDLILHLIAAHHGWARPHFTDDQTDPDGSDLENRLQVAETMRRFARLQRRLGHWGLAWLEAMVRSADYAASREPMILQPETV